MMRMSSHFSLATMVPVAAKMMTRTLAKRTERLRPRHGLEDQNQASGSRQLKISISIDRETWRGAGEATREVKAGRRYVSPPLRLLVPRPCQSHRLQAHAGVLKKTISRSLVKLAWR